MKKVLSLILAVTILCSIFAIPVMAENTDNTVWFELNGNSKLFIDAEAESYADRFTMQFLPGVDYSGFLAKPTGVFATDKSAITNPGYGGSALPYTIDKNSTPASNKPIDLKTGSDGNLYYTFEENTYLIRPEENVIKLAYTEVDTSSLTDEETIARYASMKQGSTIDVPDGKYKKIGFFTAIRMSYSKSFEISFYYKEDIAPTTVSVDTLTYGTTAADLYFNNLTAANSTSDWQCQHSFTRIEVDAVPTKTLEKIHIIDDGKKSANRSWPAFILSAWGEEKTVADIIAELKLLNDAGIADDTAYTLIKNKVAELEEKNATLSTQEQEIYNTAKALIQNYEAVNAEKLEKEKLTKTIYSDIPLDSAANSHVFEPYGTTIDGIDDPTSDLYTKNGYDYVLDFAQNYWYDANKAQKLGVDATDGDLYTWTHKPVYYKHTTTHSGSYIPLDTSNNWTLPYLDGDNVKYLTYNIKPDKKVLQLSGSFLSGYQQMTDKAKEAYSEKHASMKNATVDLADDRYKNIYILASNCIAGTGTAPQYFTADIYYTGEEKSETVEVGLLRNNISSSDDSITAKLNAISGKENTSIWNYSSDMGYASSYGWYSYEIPCDITKKVDKIKFNLSSANKIITIISILGEKPTVVETLTAIDSTSVDPVSYKTQKNNLAMANEIIDLYNINLQVADLQLYEKYLQLKSNIEHYEEIKPTLAPVAEIVSLDFYKNEAPSAKVEIFNPSEEAEKEYSIIFSYSDEKGNFLGTDILTKNTLAQENYSFEVKAEKKEGAKNVKAFVWKDLKTLKPISNKAETTEKDAFKVLSIGNSFSQGVHTYLAEIAKDAGFEKVVCGNLYIGGCSLDKHYSNLSNNKAEYEFHIWELKDGKIVKNEDVTASTTMLEGIEYTDWDVITIQQNSANSGVASSYTKLDNVLDYIHANKNENAKVAWHMTWAYQEDSDILKTYYPNMSQTDMYNAIVNVVKDRILTNDKIDFVIPAGTAVQNAREKLGDIFNSSDGQHLKAMGYYLSGLAWLNKITGTDISGITYTPNTDTANVLDILKKCAVNAVANPYSVTE